MPQIQPSDSERSDTSPLAAAGGVPLGAGSASAPLGAGSALGAAPPARFSIDMLRSESMMVDDRRPRFVHESACARTGTRNRRTDARAREHDN